MSSHRSELYEDVCPVTEKVISGWMEILVFVGHVLLLRFEHCSRIESLITCRPSPMQFSKPNAINLRNSRRWPSFLESTFLERLFPLLRMILVVL